ncbi:unnamed protein product [Ambrosiozyma monospora]|uniref:Unnamed protein product n=1 Tax=Ambrosiozyma monospora TaxID=43982 RepID=A0ACB5T414_AMBMO|nr:unnamed protein product [Ambrosiozyma monospora]
MSQQTDSHPSTPTGITLSSQLPTEIQCIILKFVIARFLYFMNDTGDVPKTYIYDAIEKYTGSVVCSDNMQAQLVSLMGYDFLLDNIICMVIEEVDLNLVLENESPAFNEFINFICFKSVKLKSVELVLSHKMINYYHDNSKILEVIASNAKNVVLKFCILEFHPLPLCNVYFKFVTLMVWDGDGITELVPSQVLARFQKLKTVFVLSYLEEMTSLRILMGKLQNRSHPIEKLIVQFYDDEIPLNADIVADYLLNLGDAIKGNKNLNTELIIPFCGDEIDSRWKLESAKQFIPTKNLAYPVSTKDVENIEQLCRFPGIEYLQFLPDSYPEDLEIVPPIKIPSSTLSSLSCKHFHPKHRIVFEEFTSLKKLGLFHTVVNQSVMSNLPKSLEHLSLYQAKIVTTSNLDCESHA